MHKTDQYYTLLWLGGEGEVDKVVVEGGEYNNGAMGTPEDYQPEKHPGDPEQPAGEQDVYVAPPARGKLQPRPGPTRTRRFTSGHRVHTFLDEGVTPEELGMPEGHTVDAAALAEEIRNTPKRLSGKFTRHGRASVRGNNRKKKK